MARGAANALNLLPLRRHKGHGQSPCCLDPVRMTLRRHFHPGSAVVASTLADGIPEMDENMRFNALVPMLQTEDMKRTIEWYESVLGFRCVVARGEDWCHLIRDEIAIMFMRNDHLGPPH